MQVCQHCKSERILSVSGKCSDLCGSSYKDRTHDGYVPSIKVIGGGDYLEFDLCLDCGRIKGTFPVPESVLDEAFPAPKPDPEFIEIDEDGVQYTGAFVTVPSRAPIPTKVSREFEGVYNPTPKW